MRVEEERQSGQFLLFLTSVAAIGGFLFGYDTGVVSGAMILMKSEFQLDSLWQELIVSVTVGGAAVFAVVGGWSTNRFGRKKVIMVSSALFAIASILLAAAQDRAELLMGRLVVGMGLGLSSMAVPMYIVEAAPAEQRGRLVTLQNVAVTFGQFFASCIDGGFSYVNGGWRYMMGLAAIPAILQLFGFLLLPESPRWLIEHGRWEEARLILRKTRHSISEADAELDAVRRNYSEVKAAKAERGSSVIIAMLRSGRLRKALIVGCALQLFQQVTGINTIMYYSATIIQMAGVRDMHTQIWLAAGVASVNFLCTFIGLYAVERIGRRPLTLISLGGVAGSLLLLGAGFQLMASLSPEVAFHPSAANGTSCTLAATCDACITQLSCGYCYDSKATGASLFNGSCLPTLATHNDISLVGRCNATLSEAQSLTWAYDWCPTSYSWLIILGLVLYLFCFAAGMGPMPWTINSELYPQWGRSTGNAASTATNWVFNLLVSMTFLTLMETITKQGAYYLYTCVAVFAWAFFWWVLPETRGRTLEDVEELFDAPWLGPARPSAHVPSPKYSALADACSSSSAESWE